MGYNKDHWTLIGEYKTYNVYLVKVHKMKIWKIHACNYSTQDMPPSFTSPSEISRYRAKQHIWNIEWQIRRAYERAIAEKV